MRWLLVAFLSGMAMLSGVAMATAADTFVYVSDSKDHAIKIFRMDEEGTLQPADVVKLDGAPGSLNPDPQNRFLFASIRSSHALFSFALDPASGKLKQLSSTKLDPGANAAYVGTDRTGKFLVSASYSGGKVVVHTISSEGKLSEEPVAAVQTEKTAHAAVFDRENQLLFVPHVAPNAVYQFRFDQGQLSLLDNAPGGKEDAGPRHLAVHPSGKFACTSDESGSSITLYSLSSKEGLKPLQTLSTLPPDFSPKNSTADVKFHPTGKYVWVSNRGHDSLAGFAFDSATSRLTALGQTPTEKTPRSFDVDPSGRFLFAGGEGSGKLAAYRIDSATGQLTRFQTYDVGSSLSWVTVLKFSR